MLHELDDLDAKMDEMNSIISDFHSSGRYESIRCCVDRHGDENVLRIKVEPVKSGPHYLRTGIFTEIDTNVRERYDFNLLLGLEFNDLLFEKDRLDTELEIFRGISADTAYFMPFCNHFFLEPEVAVRYTPDRREFLDFEHYGEYDLFKTESSIEAGTFIRNYQSALELSRPAGVYAEIMNISCMTIRQSFRRMISAAL